MLSLPSANDGGLVALSLVMCVSLGSSTEATTPTGGEVHTEVHAGIAG